MIHLKKAKLDDRKKAYNWLYHSDISPFLNSLLKETSNGIPTLEDFQEDYENFYFENSIGKGRAYLIILEKKELSLEIGFISCTSIHLKKGIAELDIWLKSSEYTGKGYGTEAVRILSQKLLDKNFDILFMRPCRKNNRAINSYKKAGFKETKFKSEYYKKEYLEELGPGDCIDDDDVFMVLKKK